MDKSKRYIKMCKCADKIMELKWEYGFVEGDYLYLGEKYGVRVMGFDYFSISSNYDEGDSEITVKLINTDPFSIDTIHEAENRQQIKVLVKELDLVVESFVNPIWLPRQDQMESFYYQAVINKVDVNNWIEALNEFRISLLKDDPDTYRSGEQMALGFIMYKMYELSWNENSGKWMLQIDDPKDLPF